MSSEVQRYITGIMTPVEMANPGPASISARQTVVVTYDDYAALEAENARLQSAFDELAERYGKLQTGEDSLLARVVTERDAACAQLAAIQGGMGEDVVVLATVSMGGVEYGIGGAELGDIDIQPDMKALCALQQSLVTGEDDAYVELIDKAQHQRITAAMAAEVEALRAQRDNMAQILRDLVPGCKWRFMRPRIDQALQEVDGGN